MALTPPVDKFRAALGWGMFPHSPALMLGASPSYAEAPDQTAHRTGAGVDVRAFVMLADWTPAARVFLAGRWASTTTASQHALSVTPTGAVEWRYVNTTPAITTITSPPLPASVAVDGCPLWLRAVHDPAAGSLSIQYATDLRGQSWTVHHTEALTGSPALNNPATAGALTGLRLGRTASPANNDQAPAGTKVLRGEWRTTAGALVATFSGDQRTYSFDGRGLWQVAGAVTWSSWAGVPANGWVDMSADLLDWSTSTGREHELTDFEPGTGVVRLRNHHRRYDPAYPAGPYFGKLEAGSPVKLETVWNGTTYDVFTGIVEDGWSARFDEVGRGGDSWVEIPLVDTAGLAALIEMPASAWELAGRQFRPDVWIRSVGTPYVAGDASGFTPSQDGYGPSSVSIGGGSGSYLVEVGPLVAGDEDSAIGLNGGAYLSADSRISASTEFMFCGTFRAPAPGYTYDLELISQQVFFGSVQWSAFLGGSASAEVSARGKFALKFAGTGLLYTVAPTGGATTWADGQPHFVFGYYNAATSFASLSVDGIAATIANPGFGVPTSVAAGQMYVGRAGGTPGAWTVDEVMFDAHPGYMGDIIEAGRGRAVLNAQTLALRSAALTSVAADGQTFPFPVVVDAPGPAGTDTFYGYTGAPPSDLRAALLEVAGDMRGQVYALRDGSLRVRPIDVVDNPARASWYRDTSAEFVAGNLPTWGRLPCESVKVAGERLDLITNKATWSVPLSATGSEVGNPTVTDRASVRHYGRRSLVHASRLMAGLAGYRYAGGLVAAASAPTQRIETLVLHPLGDDDVTAWVLGQMDLERAATVRVRPPADTTAAPDTPGPFDASPSDFVVVGNVQKMTQDRSREGWVVTVSVARSR